MLKSASPIRQTVTPPQGTVKSWLKWSLKLNRLKQELAKPTRHTSQRGGRTIQVFHSSSSTNRQICGTEIRQKRDKRSKITLTHMIVHDLFTTNRVVWGDNFGWPLYCDQNNFILVDKQSFNFHHSCSNRDAKSPSRACIRICPAILSLVIFSQLCGTWKSLNLIQYPQQSFVWHI